MRLFLFISRNKNFPKGLTNPQGTQDTRKFSNLSEIPNPSRIVNIELQKQNKNSTNSRSLRWFCASPSRKTELVSSDLYQETPSLGTGGTGRLLARIPADTAGYANLAENRAFFLCPNHTYLTDSLCFSDGRGQVPISGRSLRTAVTASLGVIYD